MSQNGYSIKNITFNLITNINELSVNLDNRLVAKAIKNLLNNALKFTNEFGEVNFKVYQKKNLFIEVIDNGIGIPKKDIAYTVGIKNSNYLFKLLAKTYGEHYNK